MILEAARTLFVERGFRGVTTRELAAAVGVTEPVLYQHFPSKRDLYRALIERKIEQTKDLNDRFRAICAEPGNPDEFFDQLARLIVDWHAADPSFLRLLMFSSLEGHELRDMFHERMMTNYFHLLVEAIGRIMDRGEFRPIQPELAAYCFCAMIGQHCLDRLLFRHPVAEAHHESIVQTMVDIYLNGLKKDKS